MTVACPKRYNALLIGYGSPLRCDDGAGFILAGELELESPEGVTSLAVHQLTPDLAARIAIADTVIFVDAYPVDAELNEIRLVDLPAENSDNPNTIIHSHASSPAALMALTYALYHVRPNAVVMGIPAENFSVGEVISRQTREFIDEAKTLIRQRISMYA